MQTEPLMPVKQALVPFRGKELLAVLLADGRIAAILLSLCNFLQLAKHGQMERIRNDEVLADQLLTVIIQTPGGPQPTDALTAWAIPYWLTGIRLKMVAPEKRPAILALKREAADVLYRYFFKVDAEPARQPAPAQAQKAPRSALEMHIKAWQETEQEWNAREERFEARIATLERQQALMKAELAALAQQQGGEARGEEPPIQAGAILSQQHIGQVYVLARQQRRETGEPISAMLGDLAETFDVPDISDIPDEGWDHILRWFWGRTQQ